MKEYIRMQSLLSVPNNASSTSSSSSSHIVPHHRECQGSYYPYSLGLDGLRSQYGKDHKLSSINSNHNDYYSFRTHGGGYMAPIAGATLYQPNYSSFVSGKTKLLHSLEPSSGLSSLQSISKPRAPSYYRGQKISRSKRMKENSQPFKFPPTGGRFNALINNNNNEVSSKNLPPYPTSLPTAFGYTSSTRLQPPEASGYKDPPILNDKLFPRDPPWNEEMGAPPGFKAPHLQMRSIVVETKVPNGGGWTPLLDGISIEVRGGELMAVMTTTENEGTCLLDLLGGRSRKWGGKWRGDLILNGNLVSPSKVSCRAAYVRQDVNFCPDMSVRQTMLLHSSLRECADHSRVAHIKAKINGLIEDLGLEQVKHTRVQDLTLSERRRLNAACHLLLETDIILLDQPTRGMDIFDTFFLVEYLRQWAARGRIVIMTIQPPTYEIFIMISRVALISTGRLMYFGRRREMLPYFAFIEYPCPAYKNPSDYYIDLVTLDDLSAEAMLESSQRVEMLAETFRRRQDPLSDPGPPGPLPPKVKHSNLCIQLLFLWIRAMIYQFPYNMLNFLGQSLVAAIISVIAGTVYFNLRNPTEFHQGNINNRVAFYYFMSLVGLWPLLLMTISEVWRDKLAVERDISDGLYTRGIYIFTKMLYSFPTAVLVYVAYTLPAYSMMAGYSGDNEEGWFYLYVGYQLLYLLSIRSLALASTSIFDSRNKSAILTGLTMTIVALGSGFTLHPKDVSSWAWPSFWWSPARWFMREMVFEEFNRTTHTFSCSRNPVDRGDIVKKIECGVETGGQALRYFGLSEDRLGQKYYPALFIFIFYLVCIFIYLIGFILGKKPNRSKKYKAE